MGHIIVYHNKFKLGIIEPIQKDNNLLSIIFMDGIHTIGNFAGIENNKFLSILSDEFEDCIINEKYNRYFDTKTISRAKQLKIDMNDIKIENNKIIAKVKSSAYNYFYNVTISYNHGIIADCDCPVGEDCKHAYRVLDYIHTFYVKNYSSKANETFNKIIKLSNYSSPIFFYNNFDKFININTYFNNVLDDELVCELINLCYSKPAGPDVFSVVYLYLKANNRDNLDKLISLNKLDEQGIIFYQTVSNVATKHLNDGLKDQDKYYCSIYNLFNNDFDKLLEFYLNNLFNNYSYNKYTLKTLIINANNITQEEINIILDILCDYKDIDKEVVDKIKPLLTTEQILKIKNINPKIIDLDFSMINCEEIKDYFPILKPSEQLAFVKANINTLELNYRSFIEQIFMMVNQGHYFYLNDHLYECLCQFKEAPIYALLLLAASDNVHLREKYIDDACKKAQNIDYSTLNLYFSFSVENIYQDEYLRHSDSPDIELVYRIYINDKNNYSYNFINNITHNLGRKNPIIQNYFAALEKCCFICTQKEKQNVIEDTNRKYQEARENVLKENMKQFFFNLKTDKTKNISNRILNKKNKLKVELDEDRSLLISVGVDKLYKVKDSLEFINALRENATYRVNKNYEVLCDINDFDEFSQQLCNILLTSFIDDFPNDKLYLNEDGLMRLIKLYNGLTINKVFYRLIDQEKEIHFSVDDNLITHMSMDLNNEDIIYAKNSCYFIDKEKHTISLIKGNKNIAIILHFFMNFNNSSIKDNELYFLKYIYQSNEEYIEIPDTLKNLSNTEQNISLYIDMENDVLTEKLVVKENGEEIKEDNYNEDIKQNIKFLFNLFMDFKFNNNKIENEDDIFNFLTADLSPLQGLCKVYLSEHVKTKNIVDFPKQNIHIDYGSSMLEAFWVKSTFSDEELEKIYTAIKRKKKFVQLKSHKIINIQNKEAQQFFELSESLKLDKHNLTSAQKTNFYNAFKTINDIDDTKVKDYFTKVIDDVKDFKNNKVDLSSLKANLRDYQIDGINWMHALVKHNLCGILADDMGLGKTLQTIGLISIDKTSSPSLIICPKSLVFNWCYEFMRFAPDIKVVKIFGSQEERKQIIKNIDKNKRVVYITSYDSLRNDLDNYNIEFQYLILDEAQAIKTFTSKKSQSVKQLKALHRFALTGTPIENSALELWSIFDFLMPGYLDDIDLFKKRFETEKDYKEKVAKRISLFILRRTKKDVLKDLPEKMERVIEAEMTTEQRKTYDAYCIIAKKALKSSPNVFEILPYLMRLRQICVDPSLFVENYVGESGKMQLIYENIDNLIKDGHKILIFSQFVKALNIVEKHLKGKDIKYYLLTGDTKAENRLEMCDQFNKDDTPIFLISLKAGGNGLNLTGADTVIHIDPWWNAAVQDQATDRAHRIGQTKAVTVLKFICENSIEEKVIELQNIKKDLIDSLISSDEKSILKLTTDDIEFLLD